MLINLRYSYIIEFLIEKFNPTTVEIPNVFFYVNFIFSVSRILIYYVKAIP